MAEADADERTGKELIYSDHLVAEKSTKKLWVLCGRLYITPYVTDFHEN